MLVLVSKVIAGDTTASMLLVLKKWVWCLACLFPDVFRLILLLTDCHTVVVYYFTSINVHNASWISQLLSWYTMLWRKRGKMRMKRAWKRSQWREKKKVKSFSKILCVLWHSWGKLREKIQISFASLACSMSVCSFFTWTTIP